MKIIDGDELYNRINNWYRDKYKIFTEDEKLFIEHILDGIRQFPELKEHTDYNIKKLYYKDFSGVWNFYCSGVHNPCNCGSNVWHWEKHGDHFYGVCNACGELIYETKDDEEYKEFEEGIWK